MTAFPWRNRSFCNFLHFSSSQSKVFTRHQQPPDLNSHLNFQLSGCVRQLLSEKNFRACMNQRKRRFRFTGLSVVWRVELHSLKICWW